MSTLIIGADGSMGKRYQAILKYLNKPFECVDKNDSLEVVQKKSAAAEGIIIATPTNTHLEVIKFIAKPGVPILCEKPISTNMGALTETLTWLTEEKINLTMTYQYKLLDQSERKGHTYYNYFRHGNDGIIWDCLQPIAIARSTCGIAENSPIWVCTLNSRAISLAWMDQAYVQFVQSWYEKPGHDLSMLLDIHLKVSEFKIDGSNKRSHRNSSKVDLNPLS